MILRECKNASPDEISTARDTKSGTEKSFPSLWRKLLRDPPVYPHKRKIEVLFAPLSHSEFLSFKREREIRSFSAGREALCGPDL